MATLQQNRYYTAALSPFLARTLPITSLKVRLYDKTGPTFSSSHTTISQLSTTGKLAEKTIGDGTFYVSGDKVILDIPDFYISGIPVGSFPQQFVLYEGVTNKVIAYIGDIQSLRELTTNQWDGSRLFFSFSNGINKFAYAVTQIQFSPIFVEKDSGQFQEDLEIVVRAPTFPPKQQLSLKKEIFRDISNLGTQHPLTGDITTVSGKASIIQSLKNLLFTDYYEIPFEPSIGCVIKGLLFENYDNALRQDIIRSIETTIQNNEPRVTVVDIDVENNIQEDGLQITIEFYINNYSDKETVKFFLERN